MKSYHDLLNHILVNGELHNDRTGVGTISVFGYEWRHDMRSGFPLLTTKQVPLRVIFEELMWFLRGETYLIQLQNKKVSIWDEWGTAEKCSKFNRPQGDLGPIYGWQWRHFGAVYQAYPKSVLEHGVGFDQIAALLHDIKTNPGSRRLLVSGWNPKQAREVELPPCHTLWQIKCNDKRQMSLRLDARSIDAFLGLPFNIASYALLLEMLCITCGYEPKELIIQFGDLHIYSNHLQQVQLQLSREPRKLPRLYWEPLPNRKFEQYSLDTLLSFEFSEFKMNDYNPYDKIPAPVAV